MTLQPDKKHQSIKRLPKNKQENNTPTDIAFSGKPELISDQSTSDVLVLPENSAALSTTSFIQNRTIPIVTKKNSNQTLGLNINQETLDNGASIPNNSGAMLGRCNISKYALDVLTRRLRQNHVLRIKEDSKADNKPETNTPYDDVITAITQPLEKESEKALNEKLQDPYAKEHIESMEPCVMYI